MGRPSRYTKKLATEICERIAGGESLRKICEDNHIVAAKTVSAWLGKREDFRTQYASAREEQADFYAEQIIEIADTETDAARARNRIDARKWAASKLAPKKYSDKLVHSGDGDAPIITRIERVIVDERRPDPAQVIDESGKPVTH